MKHYVRIGLLCSLMLQLKDNYIVYNFKQCQQCGACMEVCSKAAISFQPTKDGLKEIIIDDEKCIRCKRCVRVCPANRQVQATMEKDDYMDDFPKKQYFLAYHDDDKVRHDSSSGGATRTLIVESLKSGYVDGVCSMRKLEKYPSAVGAFYTRENLPDYDTLPNSVYHSVIIGTAIKDVKPCNRLMIVGTSCQLYALEHALKGKYKELVKVCIFCKQQKTLGSTRWLGKAMGLKKLEISKISTRYRGNGWPGNLRVMEAQLPWNRAAGLPFGRRLWTVPGCNVCGDPFGTEASADLSMMDPWHIREENDLGETLAIVHTPVGLGLIKNTPHLKYDAKTYQEVEPALGIGDIWRKRVCVPWFRGEKVEPVVARGAKAEMKMRHCLEWWLEHTPRVPFIFYRILNRLLPQVRDKILIK